MQAQNYHHGTIRKYTAALLNLFSDVEIQYSLSNGDYKNSKVPVVYSNREKSEILRKLSEEDMLSGNYNMLPHGYISLVALDRAVERTQNKNAKINKFKTDTEIQYTFNSVPYDFDFDLVFVCRGMNETSQIIEQIAPVFNPNYFIDINEAHNLSKPTRVPVKLVGIQIEPEDYDFHSSNIISVTFSIQIVGNLYPKIKMTQKIKEFDLRLNTIINEDDALRTSLMEFDVDNSGNVV